MVAVKIPNLKFSVIAVVGTIVLVGLLAVIGCEPESRKRPYGYIRLGPVRDFLKPETVLTDKRLIIRYDAGGLSAMSTLCTFDLAPLMHIKMEDGSERLGSSYNESRYSMQGAVLHGPAKFPLPYYFLALEPGVYGGVKDTLYVRIGEERGPEWRLKVDSPN